MKKLLSLLLVFIMIFALVACDDKDSDDNDDDNGGESSSVITPGGNPNDDDDVDKTEGLTLSNALIKQFEESKSMKVDIDFSIVNKNDAWYVNSNEDEGYSHTDEYFSATADMTLTIAKNDDGTFNAKLDAVLSEQEGIDEEPIVSPEQTILWFVDGVVYTYDEDYEAYVMTEVMTEELKAQIEGVISVLTKDISITDEEKNAVLKELGFAVITAFDIKENKGTISIDAKEAFDNLKAYINALDLEKDTVRKVLDDALKLVDNELTSAKLIAELERVSSLTVNEAIAEIDKYLTDNYDTTLQGIYDTIVNDARLLTLLNNIDTMMGDDEELVPAELIAQLKAIKIADLVTEAGVADVKLIDVIMSFFADGEQNQVQPMEADSATEPTIFDQINAMLDMKLGEFEQAMEAPIFTMAKAYISYITINEYNTKFDINFEGAFVLSTIEGTINYDFVVATPSEVDGKTDSMAVDAEIKIKVYDISTSAVVITAPKDDDKLFIYNIFDDYEGDDVSVYFGVSGTSNDDGETWVYSGYADITLYTEEGKYQISSYHIPLTEFEDKTIVIPNESLSGYSEFGDITFGEGDIVITVDTITKSIVSITYPEISVQSAE